MPQKILLYSNYCKMCDEVKEILRKDIIAGNISIVNIDKNADGRVLARLFGGVPTLLEEANGEIYELVLQ